MSQLEPIEWTQYWAENTGKDKPRVLLIGDSISVGYRSHVQAEILDTHYITAISTSKALDHPAYIRELLFFAEQENYAYPIIHFNNGLHGFHLNAEDYGRHYRKVLSALRQAYPESEIVLALSTPITKDDDHTVFDPALNEIVRQRNEVVRAIAAEAGMKTDDLYSVSAAHPEYRDGVNDGYHYNADGYRAFAKVIADCLFDR